MRLFARLRSLWEGLRDRDRVESDMDAEFRHHLELRTGDLMEREGLSRTDAYRRARLEFGHVESHKADARASRGLHVLDEIGFSWLDVKLGVRMAAKYPWLSVVSVVGMAVAIAIGAGTFGVIDAMMDPTLPLPAGERVVSIQNNTDNPGNPDRRVLHDFSVWRRDFTRVRDVSAQLTERRNLIVPGRAPEVVPVARMSPSGFRVAGVEPLLGRPLLGEDEGPGALPVLVIGYEEWHRWFDGDPGVVGRTVRLGQEVRTVVGVMPRGFRFPVQHGFWVPLGLDAAAYPPGEGPAVDVFGRLAPGATLEQAQAELETVGARLASEHPESHARLRPRVLPYAYAYMDVDEPFIALALRSLQGFIALLLVVVAVNVAMLVYARTATRFGEIAVRTALGASRRRIVLQLFAEALVLSVVAAGAGLGLAGFGLGRIEALLEGSTWEGLPFWFHLRLTPGAAVYVGGLAVLAGVIVGVVPGLKATGKRVQVGLQQIASRGSGMQLGRTWTFMIVAQVAVAVAILPFILYTAGQSMHRGTGTPAYPAEQMLQTTLTLQAPPLSPDEEAAADPAARQARFADDVARLTRRLEAEPTVAAVTFANDFPGRGSWDRVEVEGVPETDRFVVTNGVAANFFDVFDVPILAGRGLAEGDARAGSNAVIVDRSFADRYLDGASPVGHHVRVLHRNEQGEVEPGEWLEIVGLVPDFTFQNDFDPTKAHVFRATALRSEPARAALVVRTRAVPPTALARRLRELTAALDPMLQAWDVEPVGQADRRARRALLYLGLAMAAVTLAVLLLSAAGISALMSFTVARRRREIGIRTALGAGPRRVLSGIFARAGGQVGAGVVVGLVLATLLARALGGVLLSRSGVTLLAGVTLLMAGIGLLAALGPARRSLAIQPTEALRDE